MDTTVFNAIKSKYAQLQQQLQSAEVTADPKQMQKLSIEYNELKEQVEVIDAFESGAAALADARATMENDPDPEMITLAK